MPNDFLKDPKVKTLGELQQEKQMPEIDSQQWEELEKLWKSGYSQGLRDGIRLAREIVFGKGKTDD